MIKTFKTRIKPPTKNNKIYLDKCFGYRRFVYNQAKEYFDKILEYNNGIVDKDLKKFFNRFDFETNIYSKKEKMAGYEWTNIFNKSIKCETILDFNVAVNRFFKEIKNGNKSHLSFKKKIHGSGSFRIYNKSKNSIIIEDSKEFSLLTVNKADRIYLKTYEDISFLRNYSIKTISIIQKNFKYYVNIIYELPDIQHIHSEKKIGIDVGIRNPVVCFDGVNIIIPSFPKNKIKKLENRIEKLSYIVSKKKYDKYTPSINYIKARTKLNNLYEKVVNIRMDYWHKISTFIAKNYKNIIVDDFSYENNLLRLINKGIRRVGHKTFIRLLLYKCQFYNSNIIRAELNSTNTCSTCGHKLNNKLEISKRVFRCPICNYKENRDINAAINIYNNKILFT